MCGRYAQGRAIPELLARYARLGVSLVASEQALHAGFNIAPGSSAAVVFLEGGNGFLGPMRWGLVPHWTKSIEALKSKPINARSETASSGAMFRDAFRSRRCLVPASGFFEWQGAKPPKQPWFIHVRDRETLSFAGLWSRWKDAANGTELSTFAILTTEANATVKPIHDRMPCILRSEEEEEWMDAATAPDRCTALLRPYPSGETVVYAVSKSINKPGGGGPELLAPLSENPGSLLC